MTQLTNLTKTQLVAMVKSIQDNQDALHAETTSFVERMTHITANLTHRLFVLENLVTELETTLYKTPPKKSFLEMVQEYLSR